MLIGFLLGVLVSILVANYLLGRISEKLDRLEKAAVGPRRKTEEKILTDLLEKISTAPETDRWDAINQYQMFRQATK